MYERIHFDINGLATFWAIFSENSFGRPAWNEEEEVEINEYSARSSTFVRMQFVRRGRKIGATKILTQKVVAHLPDSPRQVSR
jgi:hypothetical protein